MQKIIHGLPIVLIGILNIYEFLIVIYALLSWFPNAYESKLGKFLNRMVSPLLRAIERVIPPIMGISFSPVIAIFLIQLLQHLIAKLAS